MCNRLTKLSVTMWYTFFGVFDDTSLWTLPKTHDPSLCDTPDDIRNIFDNCESTTSTCMNVEYTTRTHSILFNFGRKTSLLDNEFCLVKPL